MKNNSCNYCNLELHILYLNNGFAPEFNTKKTFQSLAAQWWGVLTPCKTRELQGFFILL